jgi:hypothetical protein
MALLLLALPVPALAGGSRLPVQPVNANTFDVLYSGDANIHDFWCAAGNYAARKLGARSATRIYRISEPPRRAGQGIRFSLDPAGHASSTELGRVGNDDGSLSVASAKNQCELARQLREPR